jgi:uncharacterized protein YqfB (UPF0267 family)
MKNIIVGTVLSLLALTACGPRDVALSGSKSFGASGKASAPGVVDTVGARADSCPAKSSDYTFISGPESNDARIFSGEISAYLSPGDRNCFRIGALVTLQNVSKSNPDAPIRAKLKVVKVEILAAADIKAEHADALGMSLQAAKDYAQSEMDRTKDIFKSNGMVTITFYELDKSSVDPSALAAAGSGTGTDQNGGASDGSGVVQTIVLVAQDGIRSPTCPEKNSDWSNLTSPEAQDPQLLSGAIQATIGIGDRNCYKIGSILPLQNGKTGPVRAQVIINQVQIVPYSALNKIQAKALGMDLATLKQYVRTELDKAKAAGKFDPKETVTITFFEIVADSATVVDEGPAVPASPVVAPTSPIALPVPTPVATAPAAAGVPETLLVTTAGERPLTCPEKNSDYSYVDFPTSQDARILNGEISAYLSVGDRNCFRIGADVVLQGSLKANPAAPVRAHLTISKVEIIHVSKLTNAQATALGMDLPTLQSQVNQMLSTAAAKFDPKGMVTLTYFTVVH